MLYVDSDDDERRLLEDMFHVFENYDQIISWNGDRFDFFVIKERLKKQKLWFNTRRWLWLDHLELFRRMNVMGAESGEEKVSFALEAIAQAVLGRGKSSYDSSKTWEGWNRDPNELADYCAVDTQLMRDIEQKTGYIELFLTLCEVCAVFLIRTGSILLFRSKDSCSTLPKRRTFGSRLDWRGTRTRPTSTRGPSCCTLQRPG